MSIKKNNYKLIDDYEKKLGTNVKARKDFIADLRADPTIINDATKLYKTYRKVIYYTNLTPREKKIITKEYCLLHIKRVILELKKQVPVSNPTFNNMRILTYWRELKRQIKNI